MTQSTFPFGAPEKVSALACAAVVACGLVGGSARADVLEIGPQGEVAVYAKPAVFTQTGATPIQDAAASIRVQLQATAPQGDISKMIAEASERYSVPQSLIASVAWQESRFRQAAVSPKGAVGVMQLLTGTARDLGVDPYDLRQNIHGGSLYLRQMLNRYRGDTALALAAYNAGPMAVDRHGGVPPFPETRNYVSAVMQRMGAVAVSAPAAVLTPATFGAATLAPSALIFGQ